MSTTDPAAPSGAETPTRKLPPLPALCAVCGKHPGAPEHQPGALPMHFYAPAASVPAAAAEPTTREMKIAAHSASVTLDAMAEDDDDEDMPFDLEDKDVWGKRAAAPAPGEPSAPLGDEERKEIMRTALRGGDGYEWMTRAFARYDAALATASAARQEAERDTKRLDWFAQFSVEVTGRNPQTGTEWVWSVNGNNLRDYIDDAMTEDAATREGGGR